MTDYMAITQLPRLPKHLLGVYGREGFENVRQEHSRPVTREELRVYEVAELARVGDALQPGEWWRQPPYVVRSVTYVPYGGKDKITTDALVPRRGRQWRYRPGDKKALLQAFLKVAQGRLTPERFTKVFGLLGYNHLVPDKNKCQGDPLPWVKAHARTVSVVATLASLARDVKRRPENRSRLATYLVKISRGPYALGGQVRNVDFGITQKPVSPVFPALGIIRYLANENLGITGYRLRLAADGLKPFFSFQALIQVIYWQLVDGLGSSSICRCRECGRVFVAKNPRTQFCLPQKGQQINPCKSRWNTRNTRRRQKGRSK